MAGMALWITRTVPDLGGDPTGRRAAALMAAFAERHVPLPPKLARALAALEEAPVPAASPVWGQAFLRAGEAVGMARVIGGTQFWAGAVAAFRKVVAEPVLRRAAVACGTAQLCGEADLAAGEGALETDWAARFEVEVARLLTDGDRMGQGFWAETAVRLHGAALLQAERRAGQIGRQLGRPQVMPEQEPLLCRLMFEAEPDFPESFRLRRRRQRSRSVSDRKRSGIRPKEGGVAGIRVTTQLEDLPDAMLSELILPPELIANRLLHEGVLVRHRPPFRQPKRDLLSFCLCDRQARDPASAVAKAAWADAAIRLQIWLAQAGLAKSDLIWAEQVPIGLNADVIRVETAPEQKRLDPTRMEGLFRRRRLFEAGLLPSFADTLSGRANGIGGDAGIDETVRALVKTGVERLHTRLRVGTGRLGHAEDLGHRPGDYFRRVVLMVLPATHPDAGRVAEDWPSVATALRAACRRAFDAEALVNVLVLPDGIEAGARFVAAGDTVLSDDAEITVPEDHDGIEAVNRTLGALSALFIDTIMEAVDV